MKKKILVLTPRIPYPPVSGDIIRMYNIIKILQSNYEVELVSVTHVEPSKDQIDYLQSSFKDFKIFKKNKYLSAAKALLGLFSKVPLQVNYYYFEDVHRYISERSKSAHIFYHFLIRTAPYASDIKSKIIFDMVDSIYLNYKEAYKNTNSIFWKTLYYIESKKLKNYEKRAINSSDQVFFINKTEEQFWHVPQKTHWIPNGMNQNLLNFKEPKQINKNQIFFIGKMDYQPNIDAVLWFIKEVYPLLNKEIKFYVIGGNSPKKLRRLSNSRIIFTGFLEDPTSLMSESLLGVAPMQTGGGLQNKILDILALKKPVVTTPLSGNAFSGIRTVFTEKNANDFAARINKLYFTPVLNTEEDGLLQVFNWDNIKEKVLSKIEEPYH